MPISITINTDTVDELHRDMSALLHGANRPVAAVPVETTPGAPETMAAVTEVESAEEAPKRERGKPAPGRARRTKEEIAEDDAADKADAELAAAGAETGAIVPDRQISSSPENRIGEQDAADESAEEPEPERDVTETDLRALAGKYAQTFGMDAAQADCTMMIGKAHGLDEPLPLSKVEPDRRAAVDKAFRAAMVLGDDGKNAFGRSPV